MGRSRSLLAAVVPLLGGLLWLATTAVAPPAAGGVGVAGRAGATASSELAWTAERVRVEPVGAAGIEVGGIGAFRGAIELVRTSAGLAVVNDVTLEDYVKGISEVPSSWPFEALKAQAIAARTYALWEYARQGAGSYAAVGAHICATQACQVYTGLAKERAEHGRRWTAAVEATEHQALWWRGEPIVAKYSSSNGGEMVPGGRPYLRGGPDPDDRYSPLHRWRVVVPAADLAAALGLGPRQVTAVQRAGDAVLVTAKHDPGDPAEEPAHLTLDALEFRERLNAKVEAPPGLPRTVPTVRFGLTYTDDATVTIDGRGWGHGIGMSQWGAFGKALRGMKAPDILAAYYAGLRPVRLPARTVPATIKVAVALDAGELMLAPAGEGGRLRVTTSAGETLAHAASTPFWARPARGAVEVSPAAGQEGPAAVAFAGDPPAAPLGRPVEVKVRLSTDATFAAAAAPPGALAPIPLGEPKLFAAGEVVIRVPPAARPGEYTITIDTDRGGGRAAQTVLALQVSSGASDLTPPARDGTSGQSNAATAAPGTAGLAAAGPAGAAALAAVGALAAVATSAYRTALGRRHRRPLH